MQSARMAASSGSFRNTENKLAILNIPNQIPNRAGICPDLPASALSDINLHLTHSMKTDPPSKGPDGPSGSIPDCPFPTNMLPPRLEAMVKAIAEAYHVPDVMPAAIALAIVSAAIGKGLRIASGPGRKTMGNLFFLISAGSGTGKSTVLRVLREPLDIIQKFHNELGSIRHASRPGSADGGGSEGIEGSVGLLPKPGKGKKTKRGRGADAAGGQVIRLICSEVTGQALARMLQENQQVILNATAEAGNLLDEASKVASPLGQLLLKGFSGDHVEIDRIVRASVVMEEPCISVCWLCQPHRLEKFLASDRLLEDGLLARFLVAHSKATMAPMSEHDADVPVAVSDAYGALIESLFASYGRNAKHEWTVDASPEAREVLREHHNRCAERWNADCGPLQSCIARWTEQAWKITLVLHAGIHGANSHLLTVDAATAQRAVSLQLWFACQQMRIIGGGVPQPGITRLGRLCELLQGSPDGEMTLRNLQNSHGFSGNEVRSLITSAPMQLHLQKRQNPTGGRASWVVGLLYPNP